jgi:hypothetical protein
MKRVELHRVVQWVAVVSLLIVPIMNLKVVFRSIPLPLPPSMPLAMVVAIKLGVLGRIGVWSLLAWKIWKRPRKWGLGVSLFLFFCVCFQSYLWWLALQQPETMPRGVPRTVWAFIPDEILLLEGAICCFLLRVLWPKESGTN